MCVFSKFRYNVFKIPCCSVAKLCPTMLPHGLQHARLPCHSRSLWKLISVELAMLSNHLILCQPLLLLPSTFPSIKVLSNESVLHIKWPKDGSFSISLSNKFQGWFPLGLTDLVLQSEGLSRIFSSITIQKH